MVYYSLKGGLMDVEGTIEFLLAQQARFAGQQTRLADQQAQLVSDINQITSVLLDTATSQARTNEIVALLAVRQVKTQQMLHDLIETVNRHIAGHN
jgi:hypothetical protein